MNGAMGAGDRTPRRRQTTRAAVFTSTADGAALLLACPSCALPLLYRHSVISGVKPIERWDYFDCSACGAFVYRERTRRLRPAL